jgi:C2 domain
LSNTKFCSFNKIIETNFYEKVFLLFSRRSEIVAIAVGMNGNGELMAGSYDNENGVVEIQSPYILVEIVSALNLPNVSQRGDPDPWVTVFMRGEEVHRTKVLHNTYFPIWTLESGSLFLLKIPHQDQRHLDPKTTSVSFVLREYDVLRPDRAIGTVDITLQELMYVSLFAGASVL